MGLEREKIIQIGILVENVEETAKKWEALLGITPVFGITDSHEVTGAVYRGSPCYGRLRQAIFDLENISLELISPVGTEPSFWKECLEKNGEGLHHIAMKTKDMKSTMEQCEQAGVLPVQHGVWKDSAGSGAYAYLDTRNELKVILELLEF